jgi:thiol-disulfide isomerase/thioredoxin
MAWRTCAVLILALGLGSALPAQSFEQNPLLLDVPSEAVQALDFTGQTLGGRPVRLSDLRGKVVLINFWATWCVPCQLEMPAMERLNRKLAGRPFKLLAINQAEERAQIEKFLRLHPYSFDVVVDPIGEIGSNYGANRLPMSYIVDKHGFVIRRAIGPREWDSPAALQLFEALMNQEPAREPSTAQATR